MTKRDRAYVFLTLLSCTVMALMLFIAVPFKPGFYSHKRLSAIVTHNYVKRPWRIENNIDSLTESAHASIVTTESHVNSRIGNSNIPIKEANTGTPLLTMTRNYSLAELKVRPKDRPNFDKEYEKLCGTKWQDNYGRLYKHMLEKSRKVLIFRCPRAGWANRLRALLSTFHLAVMTKRAFIIDCVQPSPLENYLAPNSIQWNYKFNTTGLSIRSQNLIDEKIEFEKADFDNYLNFSVEVIRDYPGTFEQKLMKNPKYNLPRWPDLYILMGCSFHFLFKRTDRLNIHLEKERQRLGFNDNIVVGIHMRRGDMVFGHNRGDVRIENVEDTDHYFACAKQIDGHIQAIYKTKKVIWFLATDSVEIKNYAQKKYTDKIRQLNGPVEHIANPRSGNEEAGHLSMFLDFFLLQQSDFRLFTSGSSFPSAIAILTLGYGDSGASWVKNGIASCSLPPSLKNTSR